MADFYAVLGLPKTATKDDIKKAYHKAALKTHPDRVPQEQKKAAEDSFRAVNAAYEILADDKNKALYDKYGVWPPPQTSNSTGYKPRPTQPEYKPFGTSTQPQPPFFDESGAAFHAFVFTDPFALFNMHFGPEYFQTHVPFHNAHPHSRPIRTPVPVFDGQFMQQQQQAMYQQYQSFAQAGAAASFTQSANTTPTATATSTSKPSSRATTPSPRDNEDRGWIKESKVTKVTPQGTRETTVKKTTADGIVYITRVAGDGTIRHWISKNGVETETDRGAGEIAPGYRVPLSQTQPQVPPSQPRPAAYAAAAPQQPPSSSRHAPSASQPVNSAYDAQAAYSRAYPPQAPSSGSDGHRRSASRAGHHERPASRTGHHERSASRAGHQERAHRATSPPPVPPKENKATTQVPSPTGSYPFAYPQAPPAAAPQRAKSPSPRQEAGRTSEREREKDLRRNHTVPSHVLSSQQAAPMPRPQSPHFYRTRTTSEAQNPSPTKMTSSSSSATQQPRPRYDSSTGARLTEEPASYVFSDTEAARARTSSSYKPSRSSNTVPAPAPQPMAQGVPLAAPAGTVPRRSSSRYGHQHSQSMQAATAPTRHHSVPAPPPGPMPQPTNGLGLGFVPPPSSGFGSNRSSAASVTPNPPLGKSSRNPSFEEIVYPQAYPIKQKSSSSSQQPQQPYGNPLPNPPMYREPWTAQAQAQQQARYRQAAA